MSYKGILGDLRKTAKQVVAQHKVSYVEHVKGHKNSQGELAEWVVKSHETGKILSSHKSDEAANKHLRDMHVHSANWEKEVHCDKHKSWDSSCKECEAAYKAALPKKAPKTADDLGPNGISEQEAQQLLSQIKHGDRVTILVPAGRGMHGQEWKESTGKAVMQGPQGWALNMGGRYGTPGVATSRNIVKVRKMGAKKQASILDDAYAYFMRGQREGGLNDVFRERYTRTGQGDDKYILCSKLMMDYEYAFHLDEQGKLVDPDDKRTDAEEQLRAIIGDDPNYSEHEYGSGHVDGKTSADIMHSDDELGKKVETPGAPVLPGTLDRPEAGNVNAMREALDTQTEMEVGKPIEQTQAETDSGVKPEAKTVEIPAGDAKIVININAAEKHKYEGLGNTKCNRCGYTLNHSIHGGERAIDKKAYKLPANHEWKEDKGAPDGMSVYTCPCGAMYGWDHDGEYEEPGNPAFHKINQDTSAGMLNKNNDQMSDIGAGADLQTLTAARKSNHPEQEYLSHGFSEMEERPVPSEEELEEAGISMEEYEEEDFHGDTYYFQHPQGFVGTYSQDEGNWVITKDGNVVGDGLLGDNTLSTFLDKNFKTGSGDKSKACSACGHVQEQLKNGYCDSCFQKRREQKELGGQQIGDFSGKEAGFNFFFPGQVLKEFYPDLQHEIVDYPNDDNHPMIEDIDIGQHMSSILDRKLSYVSTSPGAVGVGHDGKPQVLDGAPLRKENDIRGPMFTEEFYQNFDGLPSAVLTVEHAASSVFSPKTAAGTPDEIQLFKLFLNKVCGEIAATMIAAFKATHTPILNKIPGEGEVQLSQIEQPSILPAFASVTMKGSRTAYLLEKLNDSEVRDAVNQASAQASVWHDGKDAGFVYEVFVRAKSIDTDQHIMKYEFITSTREAK